MARWPAVHCLVGKEERPVIHLLVVPGSPGIPCKRKANFEHDAGLSYKGRLQESIPTDRNSQALFGAIEGEATRAVQREQHHAAHDRQSLEKVILVVITKALVHTPEGVHPHVAQA